MPSPRQYSDVHTCVQRIARELGADLRVAAPLGLGKPVGLLNALYRLARQDPARSLRLYTALSLTRPQPGPGLRGRLMAPFIDRHFGPDHVDHEAQDARIVQDGVRIDVPQRLRRYWAMVRRST